MKFMELESGSWESMKVLEGGVKVEREGGDVHVT